MFTIGSDPEFFITDGDSNVLPIVGLLGGTKEAPVKLGGGFAYQEDNVMAEYNIPPVTNYEDFCLAISRGRSFTMEKVRETIPNASFSRNSSVLFGHEFLTTPQAQMFGCSPDFNAYEQGRPMPRIHPDLLSAKNGAWRFAGGHIHLGYKEELNWKVPDFVVAALCDLIISIPMIARNYDTQGERRKFYGSPGRFRPTSYGIEYRSLSNRWTFSDRTAMTAGLMAFRVMDTLARGEQEVRRIYNDMPWEDVRRAIQTEDVTLADHLRHHIRQQGVEVA